MYGSGGQEGDLSCNYTVSGCQGLETLEVFEIIQIKVQGQNQRSAPSPEEVSGSHTLNVWIEEKEVTEEM